MIDPSQFDDLVKRVAELNELDLDTAGHVVATAGDCHMIDETGKVIVDLPDGRTLFVTWPTDED